MADAAQDSAVAVNPADVRLAAMNLLARREHALGELRTKLARRFPDRARVEEQLQILREENLQSDQRFAESFARQRVTRGQGPQRIRMELRQRDIPGDLVESALAATEADWSALAKEVLSRKFGDGPPADTRDKARRLRFLQYRGFEADHYRALFLD